MTPTKLKPVCYEPFSLSKRPVKTLPLKPSSVASPPVRTMPAEVVRAFHPVSGKSRAPLKNLPPQRKYEVAKTSGWISRISGQNLGTGERVEIELPFGTPRFVSAKTLKRMLHAAASEVLLKKSGALWTICEDRLRIDLSDETVQFRLGAVAIYS